jgi:nicotinate-nucleotide adenylyltransferase
MGVVERRVALYGGSFDPVHLGHEAVARGLVKLFALDEVLFIPAHVAPHKRGRRVSPALHRHAMLALATQGEERFRVSTVELDAPERPYTVETLAHFGETTGRGERLFFVMGADSWEEITTWREWERVLSLASTVVVTRPGHELGTGHVTEDVRRRVVDLRRMTWAGAARAARRDGGEAKVFFTDAALVDVSSTAIREAAARGAWEEVGRMAAPAVAEYVRKYDLYRVVHGTEEDDSIGGEAARGPEG